MTAFRAVILKCDLCTKKITVKVTTTKGGSHQAREIAGTKGWTTFENQDHCPLHAESEWE